MTPYRLAESFRGVKEVPGSGDNVQILAMLKLDASWPDHDEVAWCSAFPNYICWMLGWSRSKNLMARSWLDVGRKIEISKAHVGTDVAVIKRRIGDPGPDCVYEKEPRWPPGHMGFYSGHNEIDIYILGGNQSDEVSVQGYDINRLLGIRRLYHE